MNLTDGIKLYVNEKLDCVFYESHSPRLQNYGFTKPYFILFFFHDLITTLLHKSNLLSVVTIMRVYEKKNDV